MNGILSGLGSFYVGSDEVVALDDVREVLTNPTDEQVNEAVRATGMTRRDLRRAWAAAAGGDDV